jgi:hypothetical protein
MKNIIIYSLCVSTGILLFLQLSCNPKPPADNRIEYTKDAVFPKYSEVQMAVYTIPKDFRTSPDEFQSFLKRATQLAGDRSKLVVNPNVKYDNEIWYHNPKDPSAFINYDLRNGDFTYDKGVSNYLGNRTTPGLLKADKAVERAREHLKKLGFPIEESELSVVHVGGVNTGVYDGTKSEIYEKFTTVRFGRLLNKIPVYGHSRIIVQMAEEGKLAKVIRQWTPLEKATLRSDDMLPSGDLKKRLERSVLSENAGAQKVRIRSLQLVYYDNGTGIIEPAIRVLGKTVQSSTGRGGKVETVEYPYDTVVPLLKSPQLRYPYTHGGLAKAPTETDREDMKVEIRRSEDDIKKK